ncbi:MAG: L-lysine 6-transaminase [Planctomycetes bacterium]|nr:L-lysine 6-transaminase [Planctomycetota bacterium]
MTPLGAADVHSTLKRYMLADGFPVVFDFEKSHGAYLHDSKSGRDYLDLFSFFASQPIGFNHPGMKDADYLARLLRAAGTKPTNSDVYTVEMASFVRSFAEICIPESHRHHLFFVEGGALAVENALKTAFDWKYRKNQQKGGPDTENLEILHFRRAFHGRSGYTLSLTNTRDPRKYQYFPKFDWPRVDTPAARFPLEGPALTAVAEAEAATIAQIEAAFAQRPDRIAAIIVETIQGEGGDNHFRPEFMRELRRIADERDALLIFDEVQCGMGLTGNWWAWQGLGVEPDIFAFGKKAQVCGIAANRRIDDVDSVFKIASRINSTWGGNLVDMVRCERYLQVIAENRLLENARTVGARVRAELERVAADTGKISNVRGRGLMIAFDLPDEDRRSALQKSLFEHGVMMLPCGLVSMRFRPVLDLRPEDGDVAVERIAASL